MTVRHHTVILRRNFFTRSNFGAPEKLVTAIVSLWRRCRVMCRYGWGVYGGRTSRCGGSFHPSIHDRRPNYTGPSLDAGGMFSRRGSAYGYKHIAIIKCTKTERSRRCANQKAQAIIYRH